MSAQHQLAELSTTRKITLGAGVLLLLDSFLPWYHASAGPFSVSLSGWHQLGTLAWLLLIVLLVWEGARIAGVAPVAGRRADLFSAVGALVVVAVGAIFVIQRLSDGSLGIGFFLGVLLLVALGATAFQTFKESGGADAVRQEVDDRRDRPSV
jgi:hypothetical protein